MKFKSTTIAILFSLLCGALHSQTVKAIMPLGNSITQGDPSHLTYRYNLWQKLNTAGYSFNYVGSMNTNSGGTPTYPNASFDKDHEGHWGWRADQLLAGLPGWLGTYTPDIAGFGYQFTSHLNAQLGYMNVYQQESSGNNYFSTHTIRLFVFHTLDLRNKD